MKKLNRKKRGSNFGVPTKTRSGFVGCQLSLVLTVAALALPQAGQAGWFRTYGGSDYDEGRCVQQTLDGGYIITGYTQTNSIEHLWLIKTDSLGQIQWQYTDKDTSHSRSVGDFVLEAQDGNYVATGFFEKASNLQIWLLEMNSQGETLWTKTYGPGAGSCVRENPDGSLILVGGITGFPQRLMLLKTNSQGDSLWMRKYTQSGWVYFWGHFIDESDDGGFIVTGLVGDTAFETQKEAMWLIRTNATGDTVWSYTQGGENWGDNDHGRCVWEIKSKDYIAVANFGLLKVDSSGKNLWTKNYQNGSCVQEAADEGYIVTGADGYKLSLAKVQPDGIWLLRTNVDGDSIWEKQYGSGNANYVAITKDKGFIVTGQNNQGDLFLLKTDSLGLLGISENPIVETDNGCNVPHPIGSYIVLHYQGLTQGFRANVFDVSGRKVDQIRGDGNEGAMTWGINYPPGVYFIQALDNRNQLKTAKVVLVR